MNGMHAPFRLCLLHKSTILGPIHSSSFSKPINQSRENQPRSNMAINYPTPTTMQAVASLVFMVLITSPNAVLSSRAFLDTSATGSDSS